MGLDVYLERCDNWSEKFRLEQEFEDTVNSQNIKWDTPEYHALNEKMGLLSGRYPTETIEMNSEYDSEHMFKIGYFRSSYNSGGINNVMRTRIGKSLYDVFPESENYTFVPDWAAALVRIKEIRKEFQDALDTTGKYDVTNISAYFNQNDGPTITKEALDRFMEEINRVPTPSPDGWYMNKTGEFFNIRARSIMIGTNDWSSKPIVYLIYESEHDWDWYLTALAIVEETILWVLKQDNPNEYGLVWSS